jgi:protein translocase SecG subunit
VFTTLLAYILLLVIAAICVGMIFLTLSLNTKSEGLGAAITGSAGDSYRGVVGVEEKKRQLLQKLGYSFLIITFLFSIIYHFLYG